MREGGGRGGKDETGRSDAEGFASTVQDCLEIESGVWDSAGGDSKGLRGVHLRYLQGCSKNGGKSLKVQIFHYVFGEEISAKEKMSVTQRSASTRKTNFLA